MLGVLPILKGWIFLSLFSKCPQSKIVFLTIDDLFSYFCDNPIDFLDLDMISRIISVNSEEIETFLKKVMPSQPNLEGEIGFRFEESRISELIYDLITDEKILNLNDSEMPSDLCYFEAKWSNKSALAIILDSLQSVLPSQVFDSLCDRCNLHPAVSEEQSNGKRSKMTSESMLIKPIKPAKGGIDENVMAPTDDYSKFESKLKLEKPKNSKFSVTGNTSMLSFFKRSQ